MKQYYECHITIDTTQLDPVSMAGLQYEIENKGWGYSNITDDLILGPGAKAYATKHLNKKIPMVGAHARTERMANHLHSLGFKVNRVKIEMVVYDAIRGRDFMLKEVA